jgi:hypothetical protein
MTCGESTLRPDRALTISGAPAPDADAGLARIVATWPTLPESIRRAVLALIETA